MKWLSGIKMGTEEIKDRMYAQCPIRICVFKRNDTANDNWYLSCGAFGISMWNLGTSDFKIATDRATVVIRGKFNDLRNDLFPLLATPSAEKLKANGCGTHIVLKRADVDNYCNREDQESLAFILGLIQAGRFKDGKEMCPSYYICNKDEFYADAVKYTILGGEAFKKEHENEG